MHIARFQLIKIPVPYCCLKIPVLVAMVSGLEQDNACLPIKSREKTPHRYHLHTLKKGSKQARDVMSVTTIRRIIVAEKLTLKGFCKS